jgi:hypothetical protein
MTGRLSRLSPRLRWNDCSPATWTISQDFSPYS